MSSAAWPLSGSARRVLLVGLFLVALMARVAAALWLEQRTTKLGKEHEFADSELYWMLALKIAAGESYDDGKRQVLRTPGYPVFLASVVRVLGPNLTAARHTQAAVGALSCVLLFFLVRKLLGEPAAWLAAATAAVYPYAVFFSAVLLSEAVFTAILLVELLFLSQLLDLMHRPAALSRIAGYSALVGLIAALASLVKPSWILSIPFVIPVLIVAAISTARPRAPTLSLVAAASLLIGFTLAMSPWWIRNWRVTDRFVPTTLWVGASLYDGFNERADGSSRMDFMNHPTDYGLSPELSEMNEVEQDDYLRVEAWEFVRHHPGRAALLALIKLGRFWNPLPNAAEWSSGSLRLVSFVSAGPVLVLALVGGWTKRKNWIALAVLAGPVLYFSAVHAVFVSSVRYREAAMLPVLGLSAVGLLALLGRRQSAAWGERDEPEGNGSG